MNAVGEAELIGPVLAHLRRIGVGFITLGHLEDDESLVAALAPHRRAPDLRIVSRGTRQAQTSTDPLSPLLAELMSCYPADRVLFLDPDEFWLPASGDLRDTALLAEAEVLSVPRFNIAPVEGRALLPEVLAPARYGEILLVAEPVDAGAGRHGGAMPAPWVMTACAPKVLVNPAIVQALATGGHAPAARSLRAAAREPEDLVIAHLAISSRARFLEKLASIDATLRLLGDKLTGTDAWHWRRWQALYQAGEAEQEFRAQWLSRAGLAAALAEGRVQSAAALLAARAAAAQRARAAEAERRRGMRGEFRRLLQANELLQRGRGAEAAPLLPRGEAPLAGLLRGAAEGVAQAEAGEADAARASFAALAAAPHAPPGALLAAGRFFLAEGDAPAALACFARRALAGFDDSAELLRLIRPGAPGEMELLKRAFDRGGGRDIALLHRIKKRLAVALSGAELAAAYAALLGEATAELAVLPIAGLRSHAAEGALTLLELQAARPWTLRPPILLGEAAAAPIALPGRSLFVAALPDAVLRGRSSLIECDGLALHDIQGSERALVETDPRLEPEVVEAREGAVAILALQRRATELPEAIALLSSAPFDLGQFLTGMVPRLLLAAQAGAAPDAPILVDEGLPDRLREALDLFNAEARPVIALPVFAAAQVARAWAGGGWSYAPILPAWLDDATPWERCVAAPAALVDLLRGAAARAALPQGRAMRRVFLAPAPGARPRIANEAEVAAAAAAAGFARLDPQTPFAAQLAAMRAAEAVLAPAGPAMLLPLFAPAGARVLLLANRHTRWLAPQAALLAAAGARVEVLAGPVAAAHPSYLHLGDHVVDLAALRRWLAAAGG